MSERVSRRQAGALVVAASLSCAVAAEELETIVVTGSYVPSPLSELTASTTVMDAVDLQRLNKQQLGDVLRTVPGVLVEEQGGGGGLTSVSIRGGEANFTQVLLDGVALNDPTNSRGGSHDIGNINPATIERIEIVRGPQSAVYGSDAMGGVINIISRDPREPRLPTLRAELGERGFRDISFTSAVTAGDLGVALDLSSRNGAEAVAGSERDLDSAGLRARWQPHANHDLGLQLSHREGERRSYPEQSGGPLFATSDALDRADFRNTTAALVWDAQFSDMWQSRIAGSHFTQSEDYRSPGVAPYTNVPPNGSDTEFTRDQLNWVNTFTLSEAHAVSVGADYRDERGDSEGYLDVGVRLPTDYALSRSTTGAFVDLRVRPVSALLLQASLRRDEPDGFAAENTTRLGARYMVSPSLTVLVNWGQGFKLPSFFALGHALVGNPDLMPETVDAWDLGLEWQALASLRVTATGFVNQYQGLIDFDPEAFTNVNRREVESRGVEWLLNWTPHERVSLQVHATYTDIDVVGEDTALLGRPEWKGGAWLDWAFLPRWRTGFNLEWNGEVPAASLHTGQTVVSTLDDYQRLDWRVHWRARPALSAELAIDNLLDERYQTAVGFPAAGRTVRVALVWRLGA
ncbi:MAG: TonB-dependent receptor [Haliea sp.]|uniref:TonB-dependent receptor plug domain-containing protein n=1 Tax=Haliea sp. TaxID=1932666 RepID=UPI000C5A6261|nr:TonB-dependent receptor [Haliea sp.]MBM70463.1 TonB-dependent receptor [Haliea sp.]|tara:strand:+ start:85635 stop:87530 length:1896 start_codon:yes stop_codon:yes gene_type:complete